MNEVQIEKFNPFNLLDPFNPFALISALFVMMIIVTMLCNTKSKFRKWASVFFLFVLAIYYVVPNIYAITAWVLVNKLHWIQ